LIDCSDPGHWNQHQISIEPNEVTEKIATKECTDLISCLLVNEFTIFEIRHDGGTYDVEGAWLNEETSQLIR
jgi:hypothetical protein